MQKLFRIIAAALMLFALGCGGVDFQNVEFDLPNENEGPEYGAETP